jgi:citrate synthase
MTGIARGLAGVAVTETRLSEVDGEAGRLTLAGYPLEDLAPRAEFEETLFLLWHDRLPGPGELADLTRSLAERRRLPAPTLSVLRAAAAMDATPMDALRMAAATLGLADDGLHACQLVAHPAETNRLRALRFVAALPVIVAAYHRLRDGLEPVPPDRRLGHAANYLWMLSAVRPTPERVRALTTYLNATSDHGMNASTFTARVIASTRSCLSSALVGALGALKGPLHGGAPGPVLDMILELLRTAQDEGETLEAVTLRFVRREISRGGRIMGFGHRIYRVRDPRADVLAAALVGLSPAPETREVVRAARVVEEVVLRALAEAKPGRPLHTNVEFYTALLLHALGLESSLFSPTFAVARVSGWTAHVLEQIAEDRLIRPDVVYAGARGRRFADADARVALTGVA